MEFRLRIIQRANHIVKIRKKTLNTNLPVKSPFFCKLYNGDDQIGCEELYIPSLNGIKPGNFSDEWGVQPMGSCSCLLVGQSFRESDNR